MQRRKIVVGAVLVIAALLSTTTLFYYRDNFSTHLPARHVIADAWMGGELPLWNPWIGGGQPLAGNPNTLAFYPTGGLQILLPLSVAFNLHFWLHLFAGVGAMYAFRRSEDATESEALAAALVYGVSGPVISASAFYNLIPAVALIPLSLLAASRFCHVASLPRALQLGAALGLFGLAAEPLTVAGTAILLVALCAGRITRKHAALLIAAAAIAVAVASPQLIAFFEIEGEVERSRFGYSTETVLAASMHWWRIPEWFLGPVWGLATDFRESGWDAAAPPARWPPLFLHLTTTLVLIPACIASIRRRKWRWPVAAGLLLFLALGSSNPLLVAIVDAVPSLRFGRFPEKLSLHLAVIAAIVVGRWFVATDRIGDLRRALVGGVVFTAAITGWMVWSGAPGAAMVHACFWGSVSLVSAFVAVRSTSPGWRMAGVVVPAALAACVSIPLDRNTHYTRRVIDDWPVRRIATIGSAASSSGMSGAREHYRVMASMPVPHFGVLTGWSFGLDKSPEGMFSAASRLIHERSRSAGYERLERWAAVASVTGIVDLRAPEANLTPVREPTAPLWSPQRLLTAATVHDAVTRIESSQFTPGRDAIVPPGLDGLGPIGIIRARRAPGRIDVDVAADREGLLVLDQTFFGAWRATTNGLELTTIPVNIDRLGVVVPPGRHRLTIVFGRNRGAIAFAWVLSWLLLAAAVVTWIRERRRSQGITAPAR